jgi:hypothetical protein
MRREAWELAHAALPSFGSSSAKIQPGYFPGFCLLEAIKAA